MNILKPFMALCLMQALPCTVRAAQPDSVYVFPYPTTNDHGRRGMQFVWSADGKHWQDVAEGMVFMRCDFGAWKYMYKPRLIQDRQDGRDAPRILHGHGARKVRRERRAYAGG